MPNELELNRIYWHKLDEFIFQAIGHNTEFNFLTNRVSIEKFIVLKMNIQKKFIAMELFIP